VSELLTVTVVSSTTAHLERVPAVDDGTRPRREAAYAPQMSLLLRVRRRRHRCRAPDVVAHSVTTVGARRPSSRRRRRCWDVMILTRHDQPAPTCLDVVAVSQFTTDTSRGSATSVDVQTQLHASCTGLSAEQLMRRRRENAAASAAWRHGLHPDNRRRSSAQSRRYDTIR